MPGWFFLLLLVLVAFAVFVAIAMGYSRRSGVGGQNTAGGQNTTIIRRRPSQPQNTTVVKND